MHTGSRYIEPRIPSHLELERTCACIVYPLRFLTIRVFSRLLPFLQPCCFCFEILHFFWSAQSRLQLKYPHLRAFGAFLAFIPQGRSGRGREVWRGECGEGMKSENLRWEFLGLCIEFYLAAILPCRRPLAISRFKWVGLMLDRHDGPGDSSELEPGRPRLPWMLHRVLSWAQLFLFSSMIMNRDLMNWKPYRALWSLPLDLFGVQFYNLLPYSQCPGPVNRSNIDSSAVKYDPGPFFVWLLARSIRGAARTYRRFEARRSPMRYEREGVHCQKLFLKSGDRCQPGRLSATGKTSMTRDAESRPERRTAGPYIMVEPRRHACLCSPAYARPHGSCVSCADTCSLPKKTT